MTYQDAVRTLGAGNSPVVQAMDKVFGGLLLGGAPFMPSLLSLFGAKNELARLTNDLVSYGIDKRRKLTQFDRIQRLHAARGVLMVAAYFDAVEHADLPFQLDDAQLSRENSVSIAISTNGGSSYAKMMSAILATELPLLGVEVDSVRAGTELIACYKDMSVRFAVFIEGLSVWEGLSTAQQKEATKTLLTIVPTVAARQFEASIQQFAAESPEFAIWLNLAGHQTTRDQLANIDDSMRMLLARAESVEQIPPVLQAVVRVNRAVLSRKLLPVEELLDGLDAPRVSRAYIDPHFRIAEADMQTPINSEDFWQAQDVRREVSKFLLGYLSTPFALLNPLVILGHPGAGKSLLTQVQAAKLPSPDFVAVCVPLRDVPADIEIHEQIEYAIRLATHESVSWAEFARAAGESVVVIFLDGFDELVQATGISRSDYLIRAKRFQEIEATQGRHVAIIVTSRVTVADRMRIPGGTVAVRLDAFNLDQVKRWLDGWNNTNRDFLVRVGHGPLDLEVIERYFDLASQPLLLLMLAVYDAESGALRDALGKLTQTELYERLVQRFVSREVSKRSRVGYEDGETVENELLLLSVIAFGMFNRGAQWVTDEQVAEDLVALDITSQPKQVVTAEHRRLAGPAKDALGRFFFIHRARTSLEDVDFGTYEFLHATFSEYLVVRLVWRFLTDMVNRAKVADARTFSARRRADDLDLKTFLSWTVLSVRNTIVDFLEGRMGDASDEFRASIRSELVNAFHALEYPEVTVSNNGYCPAAKTQTARLAVYGANLVILIVATGPDVSSHELYPNVRNRAEEWSRTARFWQSQLTFDEWCGLLDTYAVRRDVNDEGERLVHLSRRQKKSSPRSNSDFSWPCSNKVQVDCANVEPLEPSLFLSSNEFICDLGSDIALSSLLGQDAHLH
ncbi:NACHT domain-containing protein [Amycolatopsis sp. GA6-003]|uniref:NACHT domain-containing protein n=1 Tax=Amycolatopsis sp. GA6-003 TaxID=2652444 RepID=UPI0039170B7C